MKSNLDVPPEFEKWIAETGLKMPFAILGGGDGSYFCITDKEMVKKMILIVLKPSDGKED